MVFDHEDAIPTPRSLLDRFHEPIHPSPRNTGTSTIPVPELSPQFPRHPKYGHTASGQWGAVVLCHSRPFMLVAFTSLFKLTPKFHILVSHSLNSVSHWIESGHIEGALLHFGYYPGELSSEPPRQSRLLCIGYSLSRFAHSKLAFLTPTKPKAETCLIRFLHAFYRTTGKQSLPEPGVCSLRLSSSLGGLQI